MILILWCWRSSTGSCGMAILRLGLEGMQAAMPRPDWAVRKPLPSWPLSAINFLAGGRASSSNAAPRQSLAFGQQHDDGAALAVR